MELANAKDAWTGGDDGILPSEDTPRAAQPDRGPRPNVRPGLPIEKYPMNKMVALAKCVMSDTLLRTDDELLGELRAELRFRRGGSRIYTALREAIAKARSKRRRA